MMVWALLYPGMTVEHLGFIPSFLEEDDPRPAKEQIAERYVSGWSSLPGCTQDHDGAILFDGDPPNPPVAMTTLRDEVICLHRWSFVSITGPGGSFDVSRLD